MPRMIPPDDDDSPDNVESVSSIIARMRPLRLATIRDRGKHDARICYILRFSPLLAAVFRKLATDCIGNTSLAKEYVVAFDTEYRVISGEVLSTYVPSSYTW